MDVLEIKKVLGIEPFFNITKNVVLEPIYYVRVNTSVEGTKEYELYFHCIKVHVNDFDVLRLATMVSKVVDSHDHAVSLINATSNQILRTLGRNTFQQGRQVYDSRIGARRRILKKALKAQSSTFEILESSQRENELHATIKSLVTNKVSKVVIYFTCFNDIAVLNDKVVTRVALLSTTLTTNII